MASSSHPIITNGSLALENLSVDIHKFLQHFFTDSTSNLEIYDEIILRPHGRCLHTINLEEMVHAFRNVTDEDHVILRNFFQKMGEAVIFLETNTRHERFEEEELEFYFSNLAEVDCVLAGMDDSHARVFEDALDKAFDIIQLLRHSRARRRQIQN
ncbi:hypothetical protein PCANC_18962 [Puccinia coronata f. sp. avenae]|uniref:Uncharacterized protein n=1 Tax=Puccinia coronata f. sp. avenae TaxID=200324 RepID=A0A2N5ST92_9BASI|nr:hypothetical protein PCANC_18962 [Puccinia coronata f. sp. avenae]